MSNKLNRENIAYSSICSTEGNDKIQLAVKTGFFELRVLFSKLHFPLVCHRREVDLHPV